MNAVTIEPEISLEIPDAATLEEWLDAGKQLARWKKRIGFMVGDWAIHGRKHFPEQLELAIGQADLGLEYVRKSERIAEKFPPHLRNARLSFDHHDVAGGLNDATEQLDFLRKAEINQWSVKELRAEVVLHDHELGRRYTDTDIDNSHYTCLVRDWNRATRTAREDFLAVANLVGFGIIDEDKVLSDAEG